MSVGTTTPSYPHYAPGEGGDTSSPCSCAEGIGEAKCKRRRAERLFGQTNSKFQKQFLKVNKCWLPVYALNTHNIPLKKALKRYSLALIQHVIIFMQHLLLVNVIHFHIKNDSFNTPPTTY